MLPNTPLRPPARWRGLTTSVVMCASLLSACGGSSTAAPASTNPTGSSVTLTVNTLRTDLQSPWALAFLPDGQALITEKRGTLQRWDPRSNTLSAIAGLPPVNSSGQGGLLDVAVGPSFASDAHIYWAYAEPGSGSEAGLNGTAVARGRLVGNTLHNVVVIYRQTPKVSGTGHYGSRLVFAPDGNVFVTLGERQQDNPSNPGNAHAQNLNKSLGKVVRIAPDGSTPAGNPTLGGLPQLWSLGHRNPQGAALHPDTGELWLNEHGPQGGDELNHVRPGANHGWPLRSYGCPYGSPVGTACRVGGGAHAPTYTEPVSTWVPTSVAPAGLLFVTSDKFPEWRGHALMGSLAGQALWRIQLNGDTEVARERLLADLSERIRDVRQGPDGWFYVLTDSGKLLRVRR